MNIYEKEIYSYLILTIEHFTFYKKKYLYKKKKDNKQMVKKRIDIVRLTSLKQD
jgi:hypothetical protein